MPRVFLSPSDQDNNAVSGGGHEQQYAQARCARAAEVLRAHGVEVLISQRGIGDDSGGYAASVDEGDAWNPDLYVADHTNATGSATVRRSGVEAYVYLSDPASVRLGQAINARMDPLVPGGTRILDGSHLYEVNGPRATAVLMESGYHDNPTDAEAIRTRTREMGEALAYGVLDYLGIPTHQEDEVTEAQMTELVQRIFNYEVARGGEGAGIGPKTSLGAVVGWSDHNFLSLHGAISRATSGLMEGIAALQAGDTARAADIAAQVRAELEGMQVVVQAPGTVSGQVSQ